VTAHVRNLLELAADRVTGEVPAAPVDDVVAAGRDRLRRRRLRALTGAAGAAVAVVAGALAVPQLASPGDPSALPRGGGSGDMVCGGLRFDRADLPGRPLREGRGARLTGRRGSRFASSASEGSSRARAWPWRWTCRALRS
jgi:hypothetical protein